MTKINTRFADDTDLSQPRIGHITHMINTAYELAESGMWKSGGTRTNTLLVEQNVKDKALLLAELDNTIVGSLLVQLKDKQTCEMGVIVADVTFRKLGIGSALINTAEQWAIEQGCKVMRLELLTPRNWSHPSKEFLKQWYTRLNYIPKQTESFEKVYPQKIAELDTECDFTVWLKALCLITQ
ncbi:MAG: GNAT family N-acetyltransferase [Algicola sp.]|nr:GNAT family N-acetyltransferase [Algicola sp.]